MLHRFYYHWRKFWTRFNGPGMFGCFASRLASWRLAPYHGKMALAKLYPRGFVAHTAHVDYPRLSRGQHVLVGDHVVLSVGGNEPGPIAMGDHAKLFGDTFIQTGNGGAVRIGEHTHIQPGCHFRAFVSDIEIGDHVEIASGCAIYSFDHGMTPGQLICEQSLTSKGPIRIGRGAWLGHGVTVLSGVCIGEGAVVAAGAVVTADIPANMIAGGVPAKVIKPRA